MRIATFNILHGRSLDDGRVDPARLSACIRRLNPDVLALQEVDVDQPRSSRADLTALAAEAMGAASHRFVAAIAGTPGATWMAATGREQRGTAAYGIALLSRYPAISWQVLRLPRIPVKDEPRAAMAAQLDTPLGILTVVNTHLSFVPGWNRVQLNHLMRDVRDLPGPRVVMGDLNTSAALGRRTRLRPLAAAPTFPVRCPDRQLDHILTDHDDLVVTEAYTPVLPISDHRPLVIDVSLRAGAVGP
ncbi:endonuclease/exonuclease/phosphatase family protein [Mycolicibacterium sarraceniae]|uniref:Endonuclease/exonuclease/phosphatase n=1 Tax=Mycolicibacterium sarraceniae TaxID=1534348 RepID=A0A7I7SQV8_9MYCO|nr:endonuclease/exonuclease/phosphatase family protein [Mycolicibacterium sarraceniae]BBY59382.1 endonuclease/exonuclease/phosphatase [Mycolicibacterium sarraceniae]